MSSTFAPAFSISPASQVARPLLLPVSAAAAVRLALRQATASVTVPASSPAPT
jgi:hypothetical protein